ncbi:hypothetical protein [Paraburkholderia nodosa]|nr:hypothetical protein [Paraburkholderia nodosa]
MSEHNDAGPRPGETVKPVGTWVVGGFLIASVLAAWLLVSLVFLSRS